jgi:hypothetical protein
MQKAKTSDFNSNPATKEEMPKMFLVKTQGLMMFSQLHILKKEKVFPVLN